MVFSKLIVCLSLAVVAAAWCGTEQPAWNSSFIHTMKSLQAARRIKTPSFRRDDNTSTITIPTYMHAVVNTSAPAFVADDASLQAQLDLLADRFAPHDIKFTLQGTTRTVDDDLSKGDSSPNFTGFKYGHRQGDYATLNMYFVTDMDVSTGGSCSLPGTKGTPLAMLDGCTMQAGSLPGQIFNGTVSIGEISVHEVGHWLGLLHTFASPCDGDGDLVDDTPAELSYVMNACPIGKDTCPDQPGLDPIHNFMDYSGEGCWEEFTLGQQQRMHDSYITLRQN